MEICFYIKKEYCAFLHSYELFMASSGREDGNGADDNLFQDLHPDVREELARAFKDRNIAALTRVFDEHSIAQGDREDILLELAGVDKGVTPRDLLSRIENALSFLPPPRKGELQTAARPARARTPEEVDVILRKVKEIAMAHDMVCSDAQLLIAILFVQQDLAGQARHPDEQLVRLIWLYLRDF